jgi:Uncharacterized protein conserved in bacteria
MSSDTQQKQGAHAPKKRTGLIALVVLIAAIAIAAVVFIAVGAGMSEPSSDEGALDVAEPEYNAEGQLTNPVDWNTWIERNPDVYAWVKIDDTDVDEPILQHPLEDNYYLNRDVDGQRGGYGALYTQGSHNSKNLGEDPVTIVYGHTFQNNVEMFSTLHNLEDAEFFESHPEFYIYTPTERLTYEIVSAFEYGNDHIFETQDMSDTAVRQAFYDMVQDPDSLNKNVRTLDVPLDAETDKLLVLSTCTKPSNPNARYLIVAKLVAEEPTETVEISADGSNEVIDEGVLE